MEYDSDAVGYVWSCAVNAGSMHGQKVRVIGSKASIEWWDERPNQMTFEVQGEPVRILERGMGYLHAAALHDDRIGPDHPDYGHFCIGAGHGFDYNDMITVEMKDMVEGVAAGQPLWPSFRDAVHTALVVDAVLRSQQEKRWVPIQELEQELNP